MEQSIPFRKAKVFMRQLSGKEPRLKIDVKLPTENYSDWDVVPDLLEKDDIVYSFGICDDIGFELDAIQKKVNIFAFDPTPYSVDWIKTQKLPSNFKFYPWAASGTDGEFFLYPRVQKKGKKSTVMYTFHKEAGAGDDGVKVKALTLQTIAKELGHSKIDVLKMDIEGAEYEVVDSLLASSLRPKMVLIEFHHRFKGIGRNKTSKAVKDLREAGYLIASVSITNREVCFVYNSALA